MDILRKFFKMPRKLNRLEILDLQDLNRLASMERIKAQEIEKNTALIPDGQKVAKQQKAIADLMENFKKNFISQKLLELGYKPSQKVDLDLMTGEITLNDES